MDIELIDRVLGVLGSGFDVDSDREGWVFACSRCSEKSAGGNGKHKSDCELGLLIADLEKMRDEEN